MALSIIVEPALDKLIYLAGNPESEEFARWIKTEVLPKIQLSAIDEMNPGITKDIFIKAQSLLLSAQGKTHLQAVKETMQELSDNHPREYQQMLRRIDIDHDFLFDLDDANDCSLDFILEN